jgi:hypothetical protein
VLLLLPTQSSAVGSVGSLFVAHSRRSTCAVTCHAAPPVRGVTLLLVSEVIVGEKTLACFKENERIEVHCLLSLLVLADRFGRKRYEWQQQRAAAKQHPWFSRGNADEPGPIQRIKSRHFSGNVLYIHLQR